jgi:cation transport regulator
MPYRSNNELPPSVRDNLPGEAERIYKEAFNNAEKQYRDPQNRRDPEESKDAVAAKVAWSAVKRKFKKQGDTWVKK